MISIIVAMAKNGVIGKNGEIPWYLPDDFKHFAKITKQHTVIMGRKTYLSILKRLGKNLPERQNVVITSQHDFNAPDCIIIHSIDEVVQMFSRIQEEVFVIGGAEIYAQFLPHAHKLYMTEISANCDGDTFFPSFEKESWKEISSEHHGKDEKHPYEFTYREFVRR